VGVFFAGPIPAGAFVEPPASVESKTRPREALELAGAGIYTNLIIAGIALAGYLWLLSGLKPQNSEALALLIRAWDNRPGARQGEDRLLPLDGHRSHPRCHPPDSVDPLPLLKSQNSPLLAKFSVK